MSAGTPVRAEVRRTSHLEVLPATAASARAVDVMCVTNLLMLQKDNHAR